MSAGCVGLVAELRRKNNPARKSTTTTSSNDVTNANKAPEATPGRMTGSITLKNAVNGVAPRLAAARIRL